MTPVAMEPRARLRLPYKLRLTRERDFQRVYREGRRARGAFLTVVLAPNGLEHSRVGLSVGKRCWRGAVGRNRVRRVFREAFRLSVPELPGGFDVILVGSTARLDARLEPVRDELVRLVREAVSKPPRAPRK